VTVPLWNTTAAPRQRAEFILRFSWVAPAMSQIHTALATTRARLTTVR